MSPSLTALFCLGESPGVTGRCLLPKPSLRALPSSLVPLERPVTIWCQGPPGVDLYRLEKLGSKKYEDQNFLSISAMKTSHAGRYRCSYQNGSQWSLPSDHLELVATGVFDKPSLTAHPSHVVLPGGGVTLKCQSQYGFDQFALYKEGDAGFYKRLEKQYLADFPMAPVTTAHSGTYRCYSFSNVSPYLWSSPSNPMVLTVTGKGCRPHSPSSASEANVPVSPEGSSAPVGLARQDHTQGNLVRICLGAVVLILLLGVVAEDWHSQRRALGPRVKPWPPSPRVCAAQERSSGSGTGWTAAVCGARVGTHGTCDNSCHLGDPCRPLSHLVDPGAPVPRDVHLGPTEATTSRLGQPLGHCTGFASFLGFTLR
uniref:Immunoglobulin domain-containing protein n=1 Tax=Spermophilus dauricus TaxID=99837 RepID=A0A8C9PK13_SPEDA